MLSLFPSLLMLEGFSPLLLRLTIGSVFIFWSYEKLKFRENTKSTSIGVLELIIGTFLIVGFLTQLVALISAIILGIQIKNKIQQKAFLSNGINYYLILFIISISILFSGAGFVAFDLPL